MEGVPHWILMLLPVVWLLTGRAGDTDSSEALRPYCQQPGVVGPIVGIHPTTEGRTAWARFAFAVKCLFLVGLWLSR